MNAGNRLALILLCSASIVALGTASVRAQSGSDAASTETVTVTGSRVISEIQNSPTPLTLVTAQQLEATTPGNLPDALNKLPVFQGSSGQRNNSVGIGNGSGNFLNLRNFGQQRTLVLLDGHRQPYDNVNGSVNTDALPQMLIQRVDVVTGGASAVYGSDAVSGVVNFVLDDNFTGVKMEANGGISTYADGASQKLGVAAGTSLFGNRLHFETSLEYYNSNRVSEDQRKLGAQRWELGGAGTAANPYHYIEYGDITNTEALGGYIVCTACGTLNGEQFNQDASAAIPVNPGLPSGVSGLSTGGDGVYVHNGPLQANLRREDGFARFSYNVNDSTRVYVNLTAAESVNSSPYYPAQIRPGSIFSSANPYLPASVASQLTTPTFTFSTWLSPPNYPGYSVLNTTDKLQVAIGADGELFNKYDWDLYYSHGQSRDSVRDPSDANNANVFAASDAVRVTSANVGTSGLAIGTVACEVSLTSFASRYPGCVPLDPFGQNTVTAQAYQYSLSTNQVDALTNGLDDLSGTISGRVLDLWAGPVNVAFAGEMRWNTFSIETEGTAYGFVDCTGLEYCTALKPAYDEGSYGPAPPSSSNVWEFSLESDIPLVKDLPLVQTFDVSLAGRYTDYSVSGPVETWKVGLDYHVSDDVRFRATTSVDIRAPTLNDLYGPSNIGNGNYNDIHTNVVQRVNTISQANPNLVPEVARTYTGGVVFTPTFVPNLTASLDFYQIHMKNAITSVSAANASVQQLCEASNGLSVYCSLAIRPLPFSNRTAANFPTETISEELNSSFEDTEGEDIEVNYSFDAASLWPALPGTVTLRELANIQPYIYTGAFPGALVTNTVQPSGRVTSFVTYSFDSWTFNLLHRWLSNFKNANNPTVIYSAANERTNSDNTLDVNVAKRVTVADQPVEVYLSIANILNTESPIYTTDQSNPGRVFPVSTQEDAMGRYFTLGMRANF